MTHPEAAPTEIQAALSRRKLVVPILLGVGASAWLLWGGLDRLVIDPATGLQTTSRTLLHDFEWTAQASWALLGVGVCVVLRDLAYIIRLRILSMGTFRWRQAFDSIMLWELASALTPSVVGGSAVAVLILRREGMPLGRSLATVFVTALMDELFYILAVPGVLLWVSMRGGMFFPSIEGFAAWGGAPIPPLFWSAYGFIASLTTLIWVGVVVAPKQTRKAVLWAFSRPSLRKWANRGQAWADDLVTASIAMRGAGLRLWLGAMGATITSWMARFLTLNMIFLIFMESIPHASVLARQLVMWVVLMISPTPGSSGFAEVALPAFLGDVTGLAYVALVAVIWRLVTYFPYLFVGSVVLPGWMQRTRG